MKLRDMVTVEVNNSECVILKVNEGSEFGLIALGCFDGDETMFRLTKGRDVTCTVFRKDSKPYSWEWGLSGHTLVSESMKIKGRLIQSCIENDFGICCLNY